MAKPRTRFSWLRMTIHFTLFSGSPTQPITLDAAGASLVTVSKYPGTPSLGADSKFGSIFVSNCAQKLCFLMSRLNGTKLLVFKASISPTKAAGLLPTLSLIRVISVMPNCKESATSG